MLWCPSPRLPSPLQYVVTQELERDGTHTKSSYVRQQTPSGRIRNRVFKSLPVTCWLAVPWSGRTRTIPLHRRDNRQSVISARRNQFSVQSGSSLLD